MKNEELKNITGKETNTSPELKKKKPYVKPTLEIIRFDANDVVTTSGGWVDFFFCNNRISGNYQPNFNSGCSFKAQVDTDYSGLDH